MALAVSAGRHLLVVASVCGTDLDPQGLERQERILAQTGVMLESSNARAAMLAAAIAAAAARRASAAPGAPLVGAAD
jgi:FdrA protein